ncbi:MAG TPA: 1,2-phenylacetyl-CoA epoxidase subunit PaaD [Hanamia sp.]|nr:1,2-phenylacetyl-CoA epoxidase subunit PaaD [Hanamia sp.]
MMNQSKQNIAYTLSYKKERVWNILSSVNDPEIPVLSVLDLGIVRDIKMENDRVEVIITPTYSGCPAMDFIGMNIRKALSDDGFHNIKITHQLSPAWTTDWMTEEGKEKLKAYGIAPPAAKTFDENYMENLKVECPHCHSVNTKVISEFGSTACKALYKCNDCGEPFDYFKCH